MIDLYTWSTPNGRKVSIMLEEVGLPYGASDRHLQERAVRAGLPQDQPEQPHSRHRRQDNGQSVFESGAILMYLAEKTGKFWPKTGEAHWRTIEWLMWQMGGVGPMLGQVHHFVKYNKGKAPYAEERYLAEAQAALRRARPPPGQAPYVAGDYSIADIAIWPWISRFEWQTIDLKDFPNVLRWYKAIAATAGGGKGYHVPVPQPSIPDAVTAIA